jgi:leader peptidase (prepilin peptidase)/N-methyltransferase
VIGATVILVTFAGLFGLAIGSFLNVVVWRLPRGESLAKPPSACPNCGHEIRARDNVPVLGWLILRGRCRDCGEPISPRYPIVEAFTGLAFAGIALAVGIEAPAVWALPAYLYLAAISIALVLIDLDHHRLPDRIVLPSIGVGAVLLALASWASGDWEALLRAGIGGAGLYALYYVIRFIQPRGMGGGDVKLAAVLGLYLGWLGWGPLAVGAFAAFLLGGVYAIVLLITRRARRTTPIPFGPWMIAGAWLGIGVGAAVWNSYLNTFGLIT